MADVWDSDVYVDGKITRGLNGGWMSTARKIGTREIYWRYDTGDLTWAEEETFVGEIPVGSGAGSPKTVHCFLDNAVVIVTNGINFLKRSNSYKNASFS